MKQQKRAAPSKDFLYEALVQLMETTPYEDITVTDIAKKAGVSRMAYYRHYSGKDEILISHVKDVLVNAEAEMTNRKHMSEEQVWKKLVKANQKDPVMNYVMKAGLLGQAFVIFRESMMRVYAEYYGWDFSDENAVLLIYRRLGSLFGYMAYMNDRKQKLNTDLLVRHLMELAEG